MNHNVSTCPLTTFEDGLNIAYSAKRMMTQSYGWNLQRLQHSRNKISVLYKNSITERRVPELIPVLGSQCAGDVSHKPGGRLPLLSARPAVTLATLKRDVPISLLGEQRHDGCEQLA